jgi:hypothetical protein
MGLSDVVVGGLLTLTAVFINQWFSERNRTKKRKIQVCQDLMDKLDEFYCALTRVHYLILRFREIPNSLREIDLPKQLSETDWRVLLETTMLRLLEHEEASLTEASRAFFKAYNRVKLYVKEGEVIKYIEEFHVRRSEFEDLLAETYKNSDQRTY